MTRQTAWLYNLQDTSATMLTVFIDNNITQSPSLPPYQNKCIVKLFFEPKRFGGCLFSRRG